MQINKDILVERLVDKIDLKAAYLFKNEVGGREQEQLLLVVRPVKGLSPNLISPIVTLCMADMETIPFEIILEGEWSKLLCKGSLYHTYASLPEHTIYYSGKNDIATLINKKTVSSLLELVQIDYDKAKKTADEYLIASATFESKEDLTQSLFMLHQYLAVRLKGFCALLGETMGKSNNLEHIIKSIRRVAPQVVKVFEYDEFNKVRYRLLDQSYEYGRKEQKLNISREEYNFLYKKSMKLTASLDEMTTVMTKGIEAYRAALDEENKEEKSQKNEKVESRSKESAVKPTDGKGNKSLQVICEDFADFPWPERHKNSVNQLLDKIYAKHRPEQIILINYQTWGLSQGNPFEGEQPKKAGSEITIYLIVLMKNRGPFRYREVKRGAVCVTMIFLNVSYVEKAMKNGNRFVNAVWKNGWLLRKKATFDTALVPVDIDWKAKADRMDTLTCNAEASMKNLLTLMRNTPVLMDDSSLLIFQQLIDMGVKTYLCCAIGFIPEGMDLYELINWSCVADTCVVDYLSGWNEMEKGILRLSMDYQDVCWKGLIQKLNPKASKNVLNLSTDLVDFFVKQCKDAVVTMDSRIVEPIRE